MKIYARIIRVLFNLFAFLILSFVLIFIWWSLAGKTYLFNKQPVGGDYFNALTYVNFFYHHFPLPPTGWAPFWNEGAPIIGGYPWLAFYLMKPLMILFDPVNTMEIFSNITLALFFTTCILLFKQVSKNWFIAFTLTLLLVVTRATYFPLMAGGFVVSATVQWYLPTVLLFISLFSETNKKYFIVLAGTFAGLSLLQHAPTSIITIILPSILVITLYRTTGKTQLVKLLDAIIFLSIACSIGAMGLYTQILQAVSGSGTTLCTSPECWGVYPRHLTSWMHPLPPLLLLFLILLALITKIFKKKVSLSIALPAYGGFFILFLYALAAYLHLINGPANVFFPIRLFWAANLFLLLMSAFIFQSIQTRFKKISYVVSLCITITISTAVYLYPTKTYIGAINTVPVDAAIYTIPKYKTQSLDKLVPTWISFDEKNWRLDTFNPGLTQWWTFATGIPDTRGYAIGTNQDWQYFLQYATRDPKIENEELAKNRALFLLDAFGVGYHEDSVAPYPKSILTDSQIIINTEQKRDFTWYKLSPNYVSPIVSPTNSNAILFVGDEKGYENLIRTMAMTNLNSFLMIPIKGAESIDSINSEELKQFKAVILYQFKGENWSKITSYVKNGGMVFIETGTQDNLTTEKLQEVFPIDSVNTTTIQGPLDATLRKESNVDYTIKTENFSPFIFENGPWKLSTSSMQDIRTWAHPILSRQNQALLVHGMLGKGRVVWSGMNLMYHIVTYDNYEEAKLFANILKQIAIQDPTKPTFTVQRDDPRIIEIKGNNVSGVYFKENYDSGWTATANGKKIPVYIAGLNFMYIPIPQSISNQSQQIVLSFNGNLTSWLLFGLSSFSLLLAILYLIIPHPFHALQRHTHYHVKHKIIKRVHGWWQREEE